MKALYFSLLITLFIACSPRINYLGDIYSPTNTIDVVYDEGDIKKDYRVIGQLQGDNSHNSTISLEEIKQTMIEEAKQRGAEGIIFITSDSFNDNHIVRAKLIRYE